MGTVFNRVRGAFATILDALATEDLNVIVTVGATGDPAELGPQPAHVHVARYIPQSVVLPLGSDQFYNAFRVAACGAGLALDHRRATPEEVRRAVRTVLDEPIYRLNAQRIGLGNLSGHSSR